jgi:RNA-directed DNA polymerase
MTVDELLPYCSEYWKTIRGQLANETYMPRSIKAVEIPKPNGGTRMLGIPVVLNRFIMQALLQVLQPIFEPTFSQASYGYRPGCSAHNAIQVASEYVNEGYHWLVCLDLEKFFDNINRGKLREVLHQRVNDGGITRLIGKWFHAGIMEKGQLSVPDKGTPQGSIVSPLLASVFLHTVLDTWFEKEEKPRMKGHCFMVRYCDDFIMGFELKIDAERLFEVLPKRFSRYGLELNMTKTTLVQFGRPAKGACHPRKRNF